MQAMIRRNKLLLLTLMSFVLVMAVGCSSDNNSSDFIRDSKLTYQVKIPDVLIQSITDKVKVDKIEVTITNKEDSQDIQTETVTAEEGQHLEPIIFVEFNELARNATYKIEATAFDIDDKAKNEYPVFRGNSEILVSGEVTDEIKLKLTEASNLVVNLDNIPSEATSGKVILQGANNIEADIDLENNKADFSGSTISANYYDLVIKLDDNTKKYGGIYILPGRISNTEVIDLSGASNDLGEIKVIWAEAPEAPSNLVGEESNSEAVLEWQGDAVKYQIYRGTSEISTSFLAETSNLNYTDSSVTAGETYYYAVRAVTAEGLVSDFTSLVPVEIPGNGPVVTQDFNNLRIYQVFVGTFLDGDGRENFPAVWGNDDAYGDLDGVIEALDYIKGLGMNAVWLTPVFESNGNDKLDATGYFAQDYFNVDDNWGGNDKLKQLIDEAHAKGLYVFLDGVFGHHKGSVRPSPTGKTPAGGNDPVDYPGSLEFYKEVATWWIEEFEVDGWRLDQAYQVATGPHDGDYYQDKNYWVDIRRAVEEVCEQRKTRGEEWGTLGYMVAEIWDGGGESILKNAYTGYNGEKALLSAFDFPTRYKLVQTLAVEESGAGNNGDASALNWGFTSPDKIDGVYPNMFLDNHDLLRFGDLMQRGGIGEYWKRYKAAMSFVAAYTGPITIYYGDEWGAERKGYINDGDINQVHDDNCARSTGKISGFSTNEESMLDYTKSLMKIRSEHPALWRGKRENLIASGHQYADLKSDPDGSEQIVYLLNTGTTQTTIQVNVGGNGLKDLLTGEIISGSGSYSIPVDGLTGRFLLVQ
ncbi:alpha-amylase family glycosyl hydrolase [Orenia marismortui]|uniref:Glycosidase n=1 Tax=Orenia marismortui TaxID=46469 RepID=A0A4R8H2C1_9FIRM|nr:alpha-amylase family glycosyl hydrolase [Orenia marismortui]TDX52523.1 glycosidase [Orenia marismortui]